jgi:hypothetical protein
MRRRRLAGAMAAPLGWTIAMLLGAARPAAADATLHYDIEVYKPERESQTATWFLTEGKLAVTTDGSDSGRLLYWSEDDRLVLIDDSEKKYIEVKGSELGALTDAMSSLGAQLDQAMAGLTPEQRAKMKEEMAKSGMAADAPAGKSVVIEVLPMSETKTINGFDSRKNEIVTGGSKSAEVWTMATGATTVTPAEFASMQAMGTLLGRLLGAFSSVTQSLGFEISLPAGLGNGLQGIPVYAKDLEGDAVEVETTLTKLDRKAIDRKVFEIGKGYEKQEMMPAGDR